MNIDEIRDEIQKAFGDDVYDVENWLEAHGEPYYKMPRIEIGYNEPEKEAARMLVDWAYEAGKAEGIQEAQHMTYDAAYDRGYEEGKAEAIVVPDNAAIAKADYEGYERGYDDAAKDPKAWYVLDKNGEQVHIWDWGKSSEWDDDEILVIGLGDGEIIGSCTGNLNIQNKEFEKVIPDTREKIKAEIAEKIVEGLHEGLAMGAAEHYAEQFISRIEALEE